MSSKSPGQKRKQIIVQIVMLDDQEVPFQIDSKLTGKELINLVYQFLKLIESDYFGLEYIDSKGKKCWLDYDKSVSKQVSNNSKLIFCVKFYTPDPGQLEEEYTRYLYALQIKRDLAEGLLLCSDATASLLVSYILQAEIGDYVDSLNETNYLKEKRFFPHQNEEHESKIIEYHKNHIGQTPADADLNLLDIARKVELYGIIMHPAKDHEGVQLNLAVAHMGILVFQNFTKINTFSWAKIRKLSFRRKKFLVKLHPENYGFYKDTVEFYFDNRDDSKNFWKKCIENHSFFRCVSTQRMPRQKSKLLTRGSSFRYYGRTQKELIENTRENFSKNRSFDRSYHSMRCISQLGGASSVGHINGTQSLNRNLASRSTGALVVPNNNNANMSSTLSSNDSTQNFHGFNQNTSSSAHHLAYNIPSTAAGVAAPELTQQQKTSSLKNQSSLDKENAAALKLIMEQQQQQQSDTANLAGYQTKPFFHPQLRDNDSSTHGSRTIDSRYSRDKTLGLSDEDAEVNDEDDDEDEDEEDDADDYDENVPKSKSTNNINNNNNNNNKTQDEKCTCKQHDSPTNLEELTLNNNNNSNNKPTSQIQIQKQQQKNENNYYTFKSSNLKPNQVNYQQKLISLPIQQLNKPSGTPKLKSEQATDNESNGAIVPMSSSVSTTNPNKIYSRKEVITTYKEETKNTHLEEYHQTTTFYDTPTGSVEYLSNQPASKQQSSTFKVEQSPSSNYQDMSGHKSLASYAISNGLSRSTPPTHQVKQQPPQVTSKYSKPKSTPLKITPTSACADDEALNNSKNDEDIDNDDEGKSKTFHNNSSSSSSRSSISSICVNNNIDNNNNKNNNETNSKAENNLINNNNEEEDSDSKEDIKSNDEENDKNLNVISQTALPNIISNSNPPKTFPINNTNTNDTDDTDDENTSLQETNNKEPSEKSQEKRHAKKHKTKPTKVDSPKKSDPIDNLAVLVKKKKSLSQTPIVLTSTQFTIHQKAANKSKKLINFSNLMSIDNSNSDCDKDEETYEIINPKREQIVTKTTARNNKSLVFLNELAGLTFSLSSSVSASPLAFLNDSTSDSSSHSISSSSSISSSLDDFSFLASSSSSSSLSASLLSVKSDSSSPTRHNKAANQTHKHTYVFVSHDKKRTKENFKLDSLKKLETTSKMSVWLPRSPSKKKQSIKSSKQHKDSSESECETKKNTEQPEIDGDHLVERKFKSLPRMTSKHECANQNFAKIKKVKIVPTTSMSISFSDVHAEVNKLDLNVSTSMLFKYNDNDSPTFQEKTKQKKKHKTKKDSSSREKSSKSSSKKHSKSSKHATKRKKPHHDEQISDLKEEETRQEETGEQQIESPNQAVVVNNCKESSVESNVDACAKAEEEKSSSDGSSDNGDFVLDEAMMSKKTNKDDLGEVAKPVKRVSLNEKAIEKILTSSNTSDNEEDNKRSTQTNKNQQLKNSDNS